MQAIQLKREIGDLNAALQIATESVKNPEYRTFFKIWLIKAQL